MAKKLTGIFTPNLVPLDARGEIDEAEFRRYIDWLIDRGVIRTISGPSMTLIEGDGRLVTVVVDQNARVQGSARFASVARLRPRLRVVTYHQANAPVQLIQVEGIGG